MTASFIAYIAGFFDGEGCISIYRKGRRVYLLANVANTYKPIIVKIRREFGGSLYKDAYGKRARTLWGWRVHGEEAADFLATVLPYLTVKREQAILAIKLNSRILRTYRSKLAPPTDAELSYRNRLALRMTQLKHVEYKT